MFGKQTRIMDTARRRHIQRLVPMKCKARGGRHRMSLCDVVVSECRLFVLLDIDVSLKWSPVAVSSCSPETSMTTSFSAQMGTGSGLVDATNENLVAGHPKTRLGSESPAIKPLSLDGKHSRVHCRCVSHSALQCCTASLEWACGARACEYNQ